jgi:hypothetical protein
VLLAVLALPGIASACSGAKKPLGNKPVDLTWIKSVLTIYGVDEKGLYEARLDTSARKQLVAIGSKNVDGLAISPDGRFLIYTTSEDKFRHGKTRHLFDRANGTDRVIPGLSPNEDVDRYEFVGFSPDSKRVVWQDNQPSSNWKTPGSTPTLLVYATDTLSHRDFAYPVFDNPKVTARSCFMSQWGPDGHSIYSNYLDTGYSCALPTTDKHQLAYFKTDIESGKVTRLDGRYTYGDPKYAFRAYYIDGSKTFHEDYACFHAHGCANSGQRVMAGASSAWFNHIPTKITVGGKEMDLVDGADQLYVQTGQSPARMIDSGWESSCAGSNIEIVGWIEQGNYLIYRLDGNTYIYGVQAARQSVLPQLTGEYNWLPLDTGATVYEMGGQDDSRLVRQMSD